MPDSTPRCTITTPHSHSSFDDPIICPVRDNKPVDPRWQTHDAPFGHCAGCGQDLPIHTGGDGDVIVSLGRCPDCGLTTVWHPVNLAGASAQPDGEST